MIYNEKKYMKKMAENFLPSLQEDERIYLNVPYMAREFAKCANCGFDSKTKLWFTGLHNANLEQLIDLYGVNEATSENARKLLKDKLEN